MSISIQDMVYTLVWDMLDGFVTTGKCKHGHNMTTRNSIYLGGQGARSAFPLKVTVVYACGKDCPTQLELRLKFQARNLDKYPDFLANFPSTYMEILSPKIEFYERFFLYLECRNSHSHSLLPETTILWWCTAASARSLSKTGREMPFTCQIWMPVVSWSVALVQLKTSLRLDQPEGIKSRALFASV